jgi:hypothetical protein
LCGICIGEFDRFFYSDLRVPGKIDRYHYRLKRKGHACVLKPESSPSLLGAH